MSSDSRSTAELSPAERRRRLKAALRLKAQRSRSFPLSFAQQRLWLLEQLDPGNPVYNIPLAIRLCGGVNVEILNRVLSEVVARHESLRTKIGLVEDQPVQIVEPAGPQQLNIVDLQQVAAEDRWAEALARAKAEARRPFRLEEGPLIRAMLLCLSPTDHVLVVVMHHIISDDWSVGVLFREVALLYKALAAGQPAALEKPPIQYADFAAWQRQHLQGATLDRLLTYWRGRLEGIGALELPTDRPRPPQETHAGAVQSVLLPTALAYELKEIARHEGATLYMVLLAAFQVLLYRYSGQEDIAVGSPIAGRLRKEIEGLVGFFANTLVMRTNLGGNPPFRDTLRQVRQVALEAYQHQEMPLERLVEALNPPRDPSRHPLFQVIFTLQNAPWPEVRFEEFTLTPIPIDSGASKFDLWLSMRETPAGLQTDLEYNSDLFDADTAARVLTHFRVLLEAVAADADQPIAQLPLMTPAERQQVVIRWNDTARDYRSAKCLHELVETQVRLAPDAVAVDYEGQQLTYQELDARANQLARYLVRRGVGPDMAVGVCLERSLELVVSLLAILKAGGAYTPLDPDYPLERLAFMVRDSRPAMVLTTAALVARLPSGEAPLVLLDEIPEEIAQESAENLPLRNGQDDIAYVIYTSGSTGMPKGVRNTHRGICNRLLWMQEAYHLTADDRVLQKTPFSFDVSVWEFFWPLLTGARLVLARPGGHKDPRYLVKLIVEQGITTLHFVPSMLRVFLAEDDAARCRVLKRVICSGEALPYDVQERFFARLGAELHNLYGPTEAAVDVTFWQCRPSDQHIVPIGKPIANMQCYILDALQNPLPVGIPGELHLGGVGLARDYLNRPELTAEKFIPDPFSAQPGARLYKTGDLCRYMPDGNILFLGRLDQQVKIRGNRIELGEIQATLLKHPGVREAAVTAWDDGAGGKELAAYWVANNADMAPPASALREFLLASLPEYMIPAAFVPLESLPLGPNGKINYKALPRPVRERDRQSEYVAPRNAEEEQLAEIWREVLHVDRVGVHDNFFALGGHSLLAIQVVSRIAHRLQVEVPLRDIFQTPTIAELAPRLAAGAAGPFTGRPPVVPVPREGNLPLSFNQEALWFLAHLERNRASYTIYPTLRVRGPLDVSILDRALKELARRHEVLRTRFPEVDGQPIQVVEPHDAWSLPVVDLSDLPPDQRESKVRQWLYEEMGRPLDLQNGPLTRITLLRLGPEEHVAALATHHIIYDGWSLAVMLRELTTLYGAFLAGVPSPLPELSIQYADFAVWQRNYLRGETLQRLRDFWIKQLSGLSPLELPTDYPRPVVRSTRGDVRPCHLSPSLSAAVAEFSRHEEVTPFMTLLAAFSLLLQRYSGQHDIALGTPVANRLQPEIEPLIGYFVNVIVLRTDLSGDLCFREVVERVRQVALDAFAHQELTLDQVVDAVKPPRDLSRNPLFQVMFAMQNNEEPALEGMGLKLELYEDQPVARSENFELTLNLRDTEQGYRGSLSFNTDLFAPDTAERMAGNYRFLLGEVLADPDRPLSRVPLVDETQRRQVLDQWNNTACGFDKTLPAPWLFEAQAKRRPDATAVVLNGQRWTYRQLNGRANQLARYLRRQGVGPEVTVGIFMERSPELIMTVLAVLKAGGAYVPLDPAHAGSAPQRLRFMLQEAGASLVVTGPALAASLGDIPSRTVVLDGETADQIEAESRRNLGGTIGADSLAYILYTSGSTGQPKGVMVTHGNLLNAYRGWEQEYQLGLEPTTHLQMASFGFDVFTGDLVRALCSGGALVICRKEILLSPQELLDLMRSEHVGMAEFVPAVLQTLVQHLEQTRQTLDFMRVVIVGSDAWHVVDHQRAQRVMGSHTRLINSYGLTETTIDSSYFEGDVPATNESGLVPIGRPFPNVRLYVLDEYLRPTPIGVSGELYIAGDGVARGYVNSELNAVRFLKDPFAAAEGARMCRTGDRARWRADGQVEFLGRTDNQVKIRGFRIEPGEVEQVLLQHPLLAQTAVVARQRSSGDVQLVAYVAARNGAPPDPLEIKHFLGERLPAFMIPTAFVSLPSLPVTTSGKVDRRALPEPDWNRATPQGEFVAPRTAVEEGLAAIWSELLKLERVSIHDNFFDLGGHSLLALRLVSRIRGAFAVEVPLVRLFTSPTIAGLATVVEKLQEGGDLESLDSGPPVNWELETQLDPAIRVTNDLQPPADSPSRVLLTGASGFLGAFLLRELLEQTTADVYCLVRAGNVEEGREKIIRNLRRYEIQGVESSPRIIPVCGDLAEPMLGLPAEQFSELAGLVDAIYHNGARVSSVYPYWLLKLPNVTGTVEVLRLATHTKVKPVHFVSTISVFDAPEYQLENTIDENHPLEHLSSLVSGYAQSKCVAEKLVRTAGSRGLPIAVYRPGRIAADSRNGAANTSDETTILIKLCTELGMAPAYGGKVNMTPVDYVARAIVALAGLPDSIGGTFHVTNPQQVAVRDIYRAIRRSGYPLEEVTFDRWRARVIEHGAQSQDELLSGLAHLLLVAAPPDALALGEQEAAAEASIQCDQTLRRLERTPARCPSVDDDLLLRYFQFLGQGGVLPRPKG